MTFNDDDLYANEQPLISHLIELRRRLIYTLVTFFAAFAVTYCFSEHIFKFLVQPLADVLPSTTSRRLIYTGLAEAFITYVKVALFAAVFISCPIILTQIWLFIAPGLYEREKKSFLPFLVATPFMFVTGSAFAYYIIIPNAWKFFLTFETNHMIQDLPIQLEARMGEYLAITMQLLLAFGCCFELPVILILLARLKIIQVTTLSSKRKYAFLLILILSALLTPPDVLSMIGLAIPLYGLYEVTILLVKLMNKRYEGASGARHQMDS